MPEIDDFLDALASGDPVPGGGSTAALQTAMGAALLAMVTNLTIGKKRYAEVEGRARTLLQEATSIRRAAEVLVQQDSDAYEAVSRAFALPRQDEVESAERQTRLQEALKGAVVPPLETMRLAARIVELAADLVQYGNRSAISDVGAAVLAAGAGYRAGLLNVEINLAAIKDEEWNAGVRDQISRFPDVDGLEREVLDRTRAGIRGADG